MAKLTAKTRKAIPTSKFAGPDRSYPIEDRNHAQNALARSSNKSPAVKAQVRRNVGKAYPGLVNKPTGKR